MRRPAPGPARLALFDKLNLANESQIVVLGAPAEFEPVLQSLAGVDVRRSLSGVGPVEFALAFATRQVDLDRLAGDLTGRAGADPLLWFAYPKGSSRRYRCDFNRDHGWDSLHAAGFDSVRQIALDADWSALRFRRVSYIGRTVRRPR